MFENTSNFDITDSEFLSCDASRDSFVKEALYDKATHEAAHNAGEQDPRKGRREGEEDMVKDILSISDARLILVEGKSKKGGTGVAKALAEMAERERRLFATYFFSRKTRQKSEQFFITIAYQLAVQHPGYRALLFERIYQDRSLLEHKTMEAQLRKLLIEPLGRLRGEEGDLGNGIQILVDAIDGCNSSSAAIILKAVLNAAQDTTHPFQWVFFTRARSSISAVFQLSPSNPFIRCRPLFRGVEARFRSPSFGRYAEGSSSLMAVLTPAVLPAGHRDVTPTPATVGVDNGGQEEERSNPPGNKKSTYLLRHPPNIAEAGRTNDEGRLAFTSSKPQLSSHASSSASPRNLEHRPTFRAMGGFKRFVKGFMGQSGE